MNLIRLFVVVVMVVLGHVLFPASSVALAAVAVVGGPKVARKSQTAKAMAAAKKHGKPGSKKSAAAQSDETKSIEDGGKRILHGTFTPSAEARSGITKGVGLRAEVIAANSRYAEHIPTDLKMLNRSAFIKALKSDHEKFVSKVTDIMVENGKLEDGELAEVSTADFARQFDDSVPFNFGDPSKIEGKPTGDDGYRWHATYLFVNNAMRAVKRVGTDEKARPEIPAWKAVVAWLGTQVLGLNWTDLMKLGTRITGKKGTFPKLDSKAGKTLFKSVEKIDPDGIVVNPKTVEGDKYFRLTVKDLQTRAAKIERVKAAEKAGKDKETLKRQLKAANARSKK